jgi:prepilin-type N-terminal cleavage/methylation domain-containing protein
MRRFDHSMARAGGFTLLEMLVVIVLAGILVSIVTINVAPDPKRGERQMGTGDDLLRERAWEKPMTRVAVLDNAGPQPAQVLLGPGAPPVRMAVGREWVQPRWRLELVNEDGEVKIEFDETGRATLLP